MRVGRKKNGLWKRHNLNPTHSGIYKIRTLIATTKLSVQWGGLFYTVYPVAIRRCWWYWWTCLLHPIPGKSTWWQHSSLSFLLLISFPKPLKHSLPRSIVMYCTCTEPEEAHRQSQSLMHLTNIVDRKRLLRQLFVLPLRHLLYPLHQRWNVVLGKARAGHFRWNFDDILPCKQATAAIRTLNARKWSNCGA